MTNFVGGGLNSILNSMTKVLFDFSGGSLAKLLDAIGDNIDGGGGNDTIVAGKANDVITGGTGNDTISGRAGIDTMDGGDGFDFHDLRNLSAGYRWNMATGSTSTTGETAINFEGAFMGAGADNVTGTAGDNVIRGEAGNDVLKGGDGNDVLAGGLGRDILHGGVGFDKMEGNEGNDRLIGGTGVDLINGGGGNDVLRGGEGNDALTGGAGGDVFQFDTALNQSFNLDHILDFVPDQDLLFLDLKIFSQLGGPGPFFFVGSSATSPDHRIIYHTGKVFYDSDGTGPALQIAFVELDTIPILTAEDINWFT